MDMDHLSEHAFIAKLSKHPILGAHTLMAPYVVSKDQGKSTPEEPSSSSAPKSSQESLGQIIEARLTNTKPVKEHMSKLWDELEHIVTGRKVDHNELKRKRTARESSEEQPEVRACNRYVLFMFITQEQTKVALLNLHVSYFCFYVEQKDKGCSQEEQTGERRRGRRIFRRGSGGRHVGRELW